MLRGAQHGQAAEHRVTNDDGLINAETVELAVQKRGESCERHGGATALAVSGEIDGNAEDVFGQPVDDRDQVRRSNVKPWSSRTGAPRPDRS